jgi:hypothetical protein
LTIKEEVAVYLIHSLSSVCWASVSGWVSAYCSSCALFIPRRDSMKSEGCGSSFCFLAARAAFFSLEELLLRLGSLGSSLTFTRGTAAALDDDDVVWTLPLSISSSSFSMTGSARSPKMGKMSVRPAKGSSRPGEDSDRPSDGGVGGGGGRDRVVGSWVAADEIAVVVVV